MNMDVEKFKNSQDYRDICYMIDHIPDLNPRLDVLEKLGYKVGVVVVKDDTNFKNVLVSKNKKEMRMQVAHKFNSINCARCVIIEKNK